MRAQSGHNQQPNVGSSDDERHPQHPGGTLIRAMGMDVHVISLRMAGAGFKVGVSHLPSGASLRPSVVGRQTHGSGGGNNQATTDD